MYVSEKEALNFAIKTLKNLENTTFIDGVVERLEYIERRATVYWSEEKIREAISDFTRKKGRPPYRIEFGQEALPYPPTVQKYTKKSPMALVREMYPDFDPSKKRTKFPDLLDNEAWLKRFINEYNRIQPSSAKEFDIKRSSDCPTWLSIARHCGVATWRDLITLSGVTTNSLRIKAVYTHCQLILTNGEDPITQFEKRSEERAKTLERELREIDREFHIEQAMPQNSRNDDVAG